MRFAHVTRLCVPALMNEDGACLRRWRLERRGVARVTGIARSTIDRGLRDLAATGFPEGSVRRAGGGRRSLTTADPTLLKDLRQLLEPATMGGPMRPLLWGA